MSFYRNRSALFSDCLTTLSANLCSSIYQIAVLIVLQRQPPRNLQIIICIEKAFTACSLAMLPAYAPVDPACETFSACRKIKVVQRELSAAQCPGPESGVRSRAGSADLTGGFKCLYATGCTSCATVVCPPRHQPPVWCAPFVAQLWCPHRLRLPAGSLLGRLKPILFLIERI